MRLSLCFGVCFLPIWVLDCISITLVCKSMILYILRFYDLGCVFGCVFQGFGAWRQIGAILENFSLGLFGGIIGRSIEKISSKEKLERWDIEEMRSLDQLAKFDFCWLRSFHFVMINFSIHTKLEVLFELFFSSFCLSKMRKDVT